jgi:hypothetical protein
MGRYRGGLYLQINLEPQNVFTFQRAFFSATGFRPEHQESRRVQASMPKPHGGGRLVQTRTFFFSFLDFESHHRMAATLMAGAGITAGSGNGLSV